MAHPYEVEGDVVRWRAPALMLQFANVFRLVLYVLGAATVVTLGVVDGTRGLLIGCALGGFLVLDGWVAHWYSNRFLLEVDPHGVRVRGLFTENQFAWHEIERMTVGYFGIRFELRGKFSVTCSAVQKSNLASARGNDETRADQAVRILRDAAEAVTGVAPQLATDTDRAKQNRTARLILAAALAYLVGSAALRLA